MTARGLAVKALIRQEQSGYANLVLDTELKRCTPPLESRDAAFATRIFYAVLEHQNLIDWILQKYSKRPLQKLDAPVRAILRAGLVQARYMSVPVSAAVNESVKLTKSMGKTSASGMVNAILRRAAEEPVTEEHFPDPKKRLNVYYSLSKPVAELFYAQYGEESLAMAAAFYRQAEKPTAIRVNPLKTTDEALKMLLTKAGHTVEQGPWEHCLLVKFNGTPAATPEFQQGLFHVQGLASQFAALSVEAQPGQRVLDLCAAPGGKSLTMAEQMQDKGSLRSGELVKARVPLLEKAFTRCGITCGQAVCADASVYDPNLGQFDRILCDVPCTGLGVIGKKPDIRYKSLDGTDQLLVLQQKILQNAAKYLAPAGRLVYSTCTVNKMENQRQIQEFLKAKPEFHLVQPQLELPGMTVEPWGTLFLPHKTDTDGFFVAVLEKG